MSKRFDRCFDDSELYRYSRSVVVFKVRLVVNEFQMKITFLCKQSYLRKDLFVGYGYTCRIFTRTLVQMKRVDKHLKLFSS